MACVVAGEKNPTHTIKPNTQNPVHKIMQYTKDEINAYKGINPPNKVMPSLYAKMNNAQNNARIEINTTARAQVYTG